MKIIREHSDIQALFPEYFTNEHIDNLVLSKYTHYQEVNNYSGMLYSFISDAILHINGEEYAAILNRDFSRYSDLFTVLKENGFFVKRDLNESDLMLQHRENMFSAKSSTLKIVIMPTTDCNARCQYCIGKGNFRETMTLETAKKVVEFIVGEAEGYKAIRLDWYGGEPLIKKDLITYICDEIQQSLPNVTLTSVITTNLVLLNEELIDVAIKSWHIKKVNVTIDGDEFEHNSRKKYLNTQFNGYKHTIKCIQLLLEKGVTVFCRYNIDRNNVTKLSAAINEITPFVKNRLFYFFVSPLRGDNEFTEFFSTDEYNNLFLETGELLNQSGIHNTVDSFVPKAMRGYCIAKNQNCFVIAPNGMLHRCNLGLLDDSTATGSVFRGLLKNKNYEEFVNYDIDAECESCKFLPICQGGCPTQKITTSKSNSKCNKFRYKLVAISKLLEKFYI